jgi:glycosyltransferase involved in cell wall biosynthesis
MTVVLYRRRLSLTSGAGQLIRMQAEGLQAAGEEVRAACQRGAFRFALKTRLPVRRVSVRSLTALATSPQHLVVDHQLAVPEADLIFVHNLMTEARRHVERDDWTRGASREAAFFQALRSDAPIVANSKLVQGALVDHFGLQPGRVVVQYPGFRSDRFTPHASIVPAAEASSVPDAAPSHRQSLRDMTQIRLETRRLLGVAGSEPLIGFITSGEFDKRGLDIFLASAEQILAAKPDARFLVVGGKRLPDPASRHPLVANRRALYRPKSGRPERWFAALDIFLYPARFEEFGMVVSEAQASGLPVLTSWRVGAAECLPEPYKPWILDRPESAAFAEKALALLVDEKARHDLSAAGVASIAAYDQKHYVRQTVQMIRECARSKANGRAVVAKSDSSSKH